MEYKTTIKTYMKRWKEGDRTMINSRIDEEIIEQRKEAKKELLDRFFQDGILNVNEYNSEMERLL